jgi:hypothetical protein
LPVKPKERLRTQINRDRLVADCWREACTAEDHFKYKLAKLDDDNADYAKVAPAIQAMTRHCEHVLRKDGDYGENDPINPLVIEAKVRKELGDVYMESPKAVVSADCPDLPEGNHAVDSSREVSAGLDYLLELLQKTQTVKPIHKYLARLRRFLSVRRGRGGNIYHFINEFQTRKHELFNDKTYDLRIPDELLAMLLLTFADVTDADYTILMGRIDSEDELKVITEQKMETILQNVLGTREGHRDNRSFAQWDASTVASSVDWAEPWIDDSNYSMPGPQHEYPHTEYARWCEIRSSLEAESDPPLMPGENTLCADGEGAEWRWSEDLNTYTQQEWDVEEKVFKVKRDKKKRPIRRRFPRRGKTKQAAGYADAWNRVEVYFANPGGGKGKSGRGWYGPWIEDKDEFRRLMLSKGGKKGGKSKKGGKPKGMTYVGMGQYRPNKGKSKGYLAVDDALVYATFEPSDRAELMTVFAAGNRKSLSKQSSNLASDGYAIFDPGCTKAMISEHA